MYRCVKGDGADESPAALATCLNFSHKVGEAQQEIEREQGANLIECLEVCCKVRLEWFYPLQEDDHRGAHGKLDGHLNPEKLWREEDTYDSYKSSHEEGKQI